MIEILKSNQIIIIIEKESEEAPFFIIALNNWSIFLVTSNKRISLQAIIGIN